MKYRMLTDEELKHLDSDLVAFLIVNGVHAEEWEKLNKENPDKARDLVGIFSDQVFDIIYEKIRYVEHRTPSTCLTFHFGDEEQFLIAIKRKEDSTADLSTVEGVHHALKNQLNELELFKSKKGYTRDRKLEVHELLENGAVISDVAFWNALQQLITP